MPIHSSSVVIDAPVEEVFAFHRVAQNIALITPPGTRIRVEQGNDEQVTLHLTRFGMTQRMRVRFVVIDPPTLLVDEQVEGPFRSWRQTRRFERLDGGGTRLIDEVEYQLGFGVLGRIADRLVVARQIRGMFAYRQSTLKRLLEAANAENSAPDGI